MTADDEGLTKITVRLNSRAAVAMRRAAAVTEDSHIDGVNRALQVYVAIVEAGADAPAGPTAG